MNAARRHLYLLGLFALLAGAPAVLEAQEVEETDSQAWVEYQYRRRVSDKTRASWRVGYREILSKEEVLADWSRLHLVGYFTYEASEWVNLEGGLGGYYTLRDEPANLYELRTWQSAVFRWPRIKLAGRRFDLNQRIRLEQRWIGEKSSSATDFGLRLRYRLAAFIPLNRPVVEERAFYMPLMAESFSDLGGETPEFFAARLRVSTGLGYVLSRNWTLEFRYTGQKSRDTVVDRFYDPDRGTNAQIEDMVGGRGPRAPMLR